MQTKPIHSVFNVGKYFPAGLPRLYFELDNIELCPISLFKIQIS